MRTTCLLTVGASVAQDSSTGGLCPQVNKFEQLSSDDHQMSLARRLGPGDLFLMCVGGGRVQGVSCLMSRGVGAEVR